MPVGAFTASGLQSNATTGLCPMQFTSQGNLAPHRVRQKRSNQVSPPYGHLDIAHYRIPTLPCFRGRLGNWICRYPRLHGLLLETRNFVFRIGKRYSEPLCVVSVGPFLQEGPPGHLSRNKRTHACIADIRRIFSSRTHLTALDAEIFVAGWKLGAEWAHGNTDNEALRDSLPSVASATQPAMQSPKDDSQG